LGGYGKVLGNPSKDGARNKTETIFKARKRINLNLTLEAETENILNYCSFTLGYIRKGRIL